MWVWQAARLIASGLGIMSSPNEYVSNDHYKPHVGL